MARPGIAEIRPLIPALIFIFLFTSVAFSAEAGPQIPEEVYTKFKEVAEGFQLFFLLGLWFLLGAATASSCLLGRSFFVGLSNQVDTLARNVAAWKSFLIGALNFIILFLMALYLTNLGWLGLVSVIIFLFLAVMSYIGLLSISTTLGERVLALGSNEPSDLAKIIVGNSTLFTAALVPIFGQLFLVYMLFKSFGIALIWLFRRKSLA